MALINFPTSPILNQIYTFDAGTTNEKKFIFLAGTSGTSADGYWTSYGNTKFRAATIAEINAGVEGFKYIAPQELNLSKYASKVDRSGDTMTGHLIGIAPLLSGHLTRKDYVDGVSVQSTNGYTILPNGLMLQWGIYSSSVAGNEVQTFTHPFPNNCFIVTGNMNVAGATDEGSISFNTIDRFTFLGDRHNDIIGNIGFQIFAIGN